MSDVESPTIQDWLRGVTYKPGWTIEFAGQHEGNAYIVVRATEPDVCNPGEIFTTAPLFKVPENITREQFYDWIIDVCIPGVETHERWEWLRINGGHWRDPHAPGRPAFATDLAANE